MRPAEAPRRPAGVTILAEEAIRSLIDPDLAREKVREAFVAVARGGAIVSNPMSLTLPSVEGELHVKGGYLLGSRIVAVKAVTGFFRNRAVGLPVTDGLVLVFDAAVGTLKAVLLDRGYLTELRTAAAGALCADVLSRRDASTAAILGSGSQARYQVEALVRVRPIRQLRVWSRTPAHAQTFADDIRKRHGLEASVHRAPADALAGADIVVTVTAAMEPIVEADWLQPGMHVTAVGSDAEDKQELSVDAVARADKFVADATEQCLRLGELNHAVRAGTMTAAHVYGELGEILAGDKPGRERDDEITIADLTGLGIQDAAVAEVVVAGAAERGLGVVIEGSV